MSPLGAYAMAVGRPAPPFSSSQSEVEPITSSGEGILNIPSEKRAILREISVPIQKLREARNVFYDIQPEDIDGLILHYERWLSENVYLHYKDIDTDKHLFMKGAKRGNDIYRWRVMERVKEKTAFLENFEPIKHRTKTNVLFVTLTFNPSHFMGSLWQCWSKVSYYYNRYISALRKKYGKIWVLRTYEAHQNGFPHIHLLLIFEKYYFNVVWRNGKWRIKEYKDIKKYWKYGISDVMTVGKKGKDGIKCIENYIVKDMLKQYKYNDEKHKISLAMNWLFRKQAFSISGNALYSNSIIQTKPTVEIEGNWVFQGIVTLNFEGDNKPFIYETTEKELQDTLFIDYG